MRKFFLVYGSLIGQTVSDQLGNNQKGQKLSGQLQKTQASPAQLVKTELLSQKGQIIEKLHDLIKNPKDEGSTIGIILCRKKREALVEITLPKDANIHAKEYRLYLPSKEELKRKLLDWTSGQGAGNKA